MLAYPLTCVKLMLIVFSVCSNGEECSNCGGSRSDVVDLLQTSTMARSSDARNVDIEKAPISPKESCPTVTTPKTFSTRKAACMTCSNAQSTATDPNVKCYSFGCTEELCGVSDGYVYTPYNKMPNFGDDPQECSSSLEDALTVETEGDACLMCNSLLSTPNALKCYVFPCADNEATCSVDTGYAYTPYNQAPTMVKNYKECSV